MNKIRLWVIAVVMLAAFGARAALAQAQNPPQEPRAANREIVTHVLNIKYVDPREFVSVLEPFRNSGAVISPNVELKTLTISGSPEIVSAMEAIVSRLDVSPPPEKDAEITAYILVTSEQAPSSASMPAPLAPVLKQLRSTFSYKDYQLIDTIVLRNRLGRRGATNQQILLPGGDKRIECNLSYHSQLAHDDKGDIVRLSDLTILLGKGAITTNVDLRVGQMVVVGKTTDAFLGNNALIAVFSAKIAD